MADGNDPMNRPGMGFLRPRIPSFPPPYQAPVPEPAPCSHCNGTGKEPTSA